MNVCLKQWIFVVIFSLCLLSFINVHHQQLNIESRISISKEVRWLNCRKGSFINASLDWHYNSDLFGYINYKSVESFLRASQYLQILQIAPPSAHYYKIGQLLSKHQFLKYNRFGYNLKMRISAKEIDSTSRGSIYWNKEFNRCCSSNSARAIRSEKDIPYHMHFFQKILYLFQHGGVSMDVTWIFIGVKSFQQESKFFMGVSCRSINSCQISSLLSFSANSSVLDCMIDKYDRDEVFLSCVEGDTLAGGALCIRDHMQQCFQGTGTKNALEVPVSQGLAESCEEKEVMWLQLYLAIRADDMFVRTDADADRQIAQGKARAYDELLWRRERKEAVTMMEEEVTRFLSDRSHGKRTLTVIRDVVWLGSNATAGDWEAPLPHSLLWWLMEKNGLHQPLPARRSSNATALPFQSVSACHRYSNVSLQNKAAVNQAQRSCSLHFVIPGFMKAGTSYLFEALMTHPRLLRALRGVVFKETGCYMPELMRDPSSAADRMQCFPFIEDGESLFFGDGTVFYATRQEVVHSLLADNPDIKVVFAVRNPIQRTMSHHKFNFKFFQSKQLGDINDCVLFALDRTQGSAMELRDLAQQAVGAKAGPQKAEKIEALVSAYYRGFTSHTKNTLYNRCANILLHSLYFPPIHYWLRHVPRRNVLVIPMEVLQDKHLTAQRKVAYLERYAIGGPARQEEAGKLVEKYANQLQRNSEIEDPKRRSSSLIKAERDFNNSYMLQQLNSIFKFLRLEPMDKVKPAALHETDLQFIPVGYGLNSTTRQALAEFYSPFNILLEDLLGVPLADLGYI